MPRRLARCVYVLPALAAFVCAFAATAGGQAGAPNSNNVAVTPPNVNGVGPGGNVNLGAVPAAPVLTVPSPANVLVASTTGASVKRSLLLQTTEPVVVKQVIAGDLTRADGGTALPAEKVTVTALDKDATNLQRLALNLDLGGAESGEYSGDVKVVHSKGVQSLPLLVKVKDGWPAAALLLVVGMIVGTGLTAYRAKGKLRDEVLVRADGLRTQMRTDADLAAPFRAEIENHLTDVQVALDAAKWDDADAAMGAAEKVFNVWGKHRQSWLEQLAYRADLAGRLRGLTALGGGVPSPYLLHVGRELEDAAQSAVLADSPKALRDKLDVAWRQLNDYAQVRSGIEEVERLTAKLPSGTPPETVEAWRAKSRELRQRLDELTPADAAYSASIEQLRAAARAAAEELSKLVPHASEVVSLAGDAGALLSGPPPSPRPPAGGERASARLHLFSAVGYIAVLLLLGGVGFGELYVGRPTFGAWGDYFALLAWGFGAEATRASVAQAAKGLWLPGIS